MFACHEAAAGPLEIVCSSMYAAQCDMFSLQLPNSAFLRLIVARVKMEWVMDGDGILFCGLQQTLGPTDNCLGFTLVGFKFTILQLRRPR